MDGDGIGRKLELLLINNDIDEARNFSDSINRAMSEIRTYLMGIKGVDVIVCGGDDILISTLPDVELDKIIEYVSNVFTSNTGCTISHGSSDTMAGTIWSLHVAKLISKD